MEPKSSKKKKQKDKECLNSDSVRNGFTEIKPKRSKKRKLETNSKTAVEENGQKKKDADEGSQSSMRDFVCLNEQKKSKKKKKKEKENKCTITNSETEKGHLNEKKQKDEGCRSSVTKDFTEADQIGPKKKKRKEKGNGSNCTATTSGKKHKNSKEKMQNGDESSRTAAHCTLQQDDPKKKGKVGKSSITDSAIEKNHPKKKKGRGEESQSNNETNFVSDQTISNKMTDSGKACTSTESNSEIEQNEPRKNKQKGKGTNPVTNAESEHNYSKKRKGKDDRESSSTATNSKKGQRSPKKRKGNSEIKPGSSKKRKMNNSLQQSLEERGIMEDAFLIQHPQLVHDLKGQLYCEGLEGSSFTAMSAILKECILREKWEDAGRILCTMCMYQTPDVECLWKFGAHVLQNHPNGKAELVEDLYRFVRKINSNNPLQKKLEHAIFLLREDRMKDALAILTEMWVRTRGKVQQSNQQEILEKMTSAYTGLIEYCLWHDKTKNCSDNDQEKEGHSSKEAATLRKRALSNLSKVNDDPGVWDIFITKQVEILEAEGSLRKAEDLLKQYLDHNPGNPNAHVYLYEFLRRNYPTKTDKLKPVLKKLVTVLSAEDYTLDYVELLEQTGSAELVEVLPMLFNMADYSTCHCNTALWKSLVDHVISVVESRKDKIGKTVLKDCWSCRKSWWTSYHFDKHEASELVKKNPKVALQKAILAAILFGSSHPFVQKVQSAIQKRKPGLSKELENELALWCNPAL